jgi:hypothetical protein
MRQGQPGPLAVPKGFSVIRGLRDTGDFNLTMMLAYNFTNLINRHSEELFTLIHTINSPVVELSV